MPITLETKQKLFSLLKAAMLKHCPPLVNNKNKAEAFEIIGNIPTEYGSKKTIVPGMYMASIAFRTDSVVFYFFPCYMNDEAFKPLAPNTWKLLKGKTCFHFKKETDFNEAEIDALFKNGIEAYKKQGWLK